MTEPVCCLHEGGEKLNRAAPCFTTCRVFSAACRRSLAEGVPEPFTGGSVFRVASVEQSSVFCQNPGVWQRPCL